MKTGATRITILCGCLSPGEDGVGDYSRTLGAYSAELGHPVQLISIADTTTSHTRSGMVDVYRFKDALHDATKKDSVTKIITENESDWLSLQFVNFSFHPKGFIHRLIPCVQTWRQTRKLHIMFHEYWMGYSSPLAIKHNIRAFLQKQELKHAVRKWAPERMHTSNAQYAAGLGEDGICADILPLFSNIPIASEPSKNEEISKLLGKTLIVFPFAQHREWNPAPVMERLKRLADAKQIKPCLVQVGKNPQQKKHWPVIRTHAEQYGWDACALGPQDDHTISTLFTAALLGVTTKHYLIAGKSGAVQAMREHDLPVFFGQPSPTVKASHEPVPEGYLPWELSDDELERALRLESSKNPRATAHDICQTWLSSLV